MSTKLSSEDIDIKPAYLEFPLRVLEKAFGNCEVKLSRCDNDPHLVRNVCEPVLPASEKIVTISIQNSQFTDFTLILMRENVIQEGWSHISGKHVYYANFSESIQVHPCKISIENKPQPVQISNIGLKYKRLENGRFACAMCRNTFANWATLRKHIVKGRCSMLKSYETNGKAKPLDNEVACKRVTCLNCGTTFTERSNLSRHLRRGRCPALKSENIEKLVRVKSENSIEKDLPTDFERLKSTNSTAKRYKCTSCDQDFSTKYGLQRHIITMHLGTKNFKCSSCGMRFKRKETLKYHVTRCLENKKSLSTADGVEMKITSSIEKQEQIQCLSIIQKSSFVCSICNHSFKWKAHLNRHMRSHSRPPRFKCTICDVKFSFRTHLHHHRLSVHPGKKPFRCSKCDEGFKDSWHLKRHMKRQH